MYAPTNSLEIERSFLPFQNMLKDKKMIINFSNIKL